MRSLVLFLPMMALPGLISAIQVAAVIRGVPLPSDGPIVIGPGLFFLAWMLTDARRRRSVPCHEFGFLAGIYMPVSLAWYVVWTRGWKGLWLLAAFVRLLLFPRDRLGHRLPDPRPRELTDWLTMELAKLETFRNERSKWLGWIGR